MVASDNSIREQVSFFDGPRGALTGIISVPAANGKSPTVGAVIVPGGAQNRVGSHRMFVNLARELAARGIVTLRFDITGMGDSPGPLPSFMNTDKDIGAALEHLTLSHDSLRHIAIVGHCDGASGAILHRPSHPMLRTVIGLNPWARSEQGYARAMVKTYYANRLLQWAFWKKLLSGKVPLWASVRQFTANARNALTSRRAAQQGNNNALPAGTGAGEQAPSQTDDLAVALADTITASKLHYLFVIGGKDLSGAEFAQQMQQRGVANNARVRLQTLADADHSFSDPQHWGEVVRQISQMLSQPPQR